MRLEESSIFIGLKQLRSKLYSVLFLMDKANRPVYGRSMLESSNEALGSYVTAFMLKNEEDKLRMMMRSMAAFTCLRVDIEDCVQKNIIHFPKRKEKVDKDGKPIPFTNPADAESTWKIELFKLVAKVDNDMCKWWSSVSKGRTLRD